MKLKDYLQQKMRMSHIYQPVMIWTLLKSQGAASKNMIAVEIAGHDQAMIEYYESRVSNMVGKVLQNNGVVIKSPTIKGYYQLEAEYSEEEVEDLMAICESMISEFIEKRSIDVWDHRRNSRRPVPGSVRYNVLVRAHHKCELCGVDANERALEVDHIVPKSWSGPDSIDNYQALCYKCNSNKGNRSSLDLRELSEDYEVYSSSCKYCDEGEKESSAELAKANWIHKKNMIERIEIYPARHVNSYFDLKQPELNAIFRLSKEIKETILQQGDDCNGFDIRFNEEMDPSTSSKHCVLVMTPKFT